MCEKLDTRMYHSSAGESFHISQFLFVPARRRGEVQVQALSCNSSDDGVGVGIQQVFQVSGWVVLVLDIQRAGFSIHVQYFGLLPVLEGSDSTRS